MEKGRQPDFGTVRPRTGGCGSALGDVSLGLLDEGRRRSSPTRIMPAVAWRKASRSGIGRAHHGHAVGLDLLQQRRRPPMPGARARDLSFAACCAASQTRPCGRPRTTVPHGLVYEDQRSATAFHRSGSSAPRCVQLGGVEHRERVLPGRRPRRSPSPAGRRPTHLRQVGAERVEGGEEGGEPTTRIFMP